MMTSNEEDISFDGSFSGTSAISLSSQVSAASFIESPVKTSFSYFGVDSFLRADEDIDVVDENPEPSYLPLLCPTQMLEDIDPFLAYRYEPIVPRGTKSALDSVYEYMTRLAYFKKDFYSARKYSLAISSSEDQLALLGLSRNRIMENVLKWKTETASVDVSWRLAIDLSGIIGFSVASISEVCAELSKKMNNIPNVEERLRAIAEFLRRYKDDGSSDLQIVRKNAMKAKMDALRRNNHTVLRDRHAYDVFIVEMSLLLGQIDPEFVIVPAGVLRKSLEDEDVIECVDLLLSVSGAKRDEAMRKIGERWNWNFMYPFEDKRILGAMRIGTSVVWTDLKLIERSSLSFAQFYYSGSRFFVDSVLTEFVSQKELELAKKKPFRTNPMERNLGEPFLDFEEEEVSILTSMYLGECEELVFKDESDLFEQIVGENVDLKDRRGYFF